MAAPELDLVPPARISVARTGESVAQSGYREAPLVAAAALTIRFSAFHWFNLFMVVVVGLPIAFVIGSAIGSVTGGGWLAFALSFGAAIVATLFNRVVIYVDSTQITARFRPFPIWPAKQIDARRVEHVIAAQSTRSGSWSEATNVGWYVVAFLGEEERVITRQLRTRDEAVFVARTIESYLGLPSSAALDED